MSVRKPTSKDKTGEFSSVAEKIKVLKERASKLNPLSPVRKKLQKQIQNLKKSPTSVSPKLIGSGKTIGVNKTKTGQYKEKTPEVKTPFFKLKDDPSKRLREKRLALEKANKEKLRKTRLKKSAKEMGKEFKQPWIDKEKLRKDIKTYPIKSKTSTDDAKTHMIRLQAQGKRATVVGDGRGSTVVVRPGSLDQNEINKAKAALAKRTKKKPARTFEDPYKGQVKKPATGVVSKPKKKTPSGDKPGMRIGSQAAVPYSRLLSEKGRKVKKTRKGTGFDKTAVAPKPVSKVTDKPKTKDMSFWETLKKGWTNLQNTPHGAKEIAESRTRAVNKKMKEAPESVKRMKEYKQIGDMLKARQAKPTGKDIASGRKAEARRKAAKAKQQASRAKTRAGTFKDLYKGQPKKPATAVSKARTFKDPYKDQKDRKLGTAVPVKTPVSKKVVKPVSKKIVPSKLAKITPGRKPRTFEDPYKGQPKKPATGIPKPRTFEDPYKGQPKKPATGIPSISKGTSTAMSGRPEDRGQRKDYDHFLSSKGGIEGFQRNLFGKNKTVAEASKAAKEAYDREQEDRKRPGQSDFYQYGEGRRSQLKKGGRVGKKKQGYKARKDESIAMRVKKKRTKKQLKASRSDSYGKWGKGKGKGKINRSGAALVAASYD